MLKLENISKTFEDGFVALDGIDLEVEKGEFVVLLGPSGSGKTTLIRSINGLLQPDTGTIKFNGELLTNEGKMPIRRQMGVVFQDFNLVENLTALNNVLTGLLFSSNKFFSLFYLFNERQKLRALEVLNRVGLLKKAYSRVSTLSGGEKQRVGIARAIVKEPTLLLADEPVASLDPEISVIILKLIRNLSKEFGITTICSLHQVDLALEFSDRIVGLSNGKIVINAPKDKVKLSTISKMYSDVAEGLAIKHS